MWCRKWCRWRSTNSAQSCPTLLSAANPSGSLTSRHYNSKVSYYCSHYTSVSYSSSDDTGLLEICIESLLTLVIVGEGIDNIYCHIWYFFLCLVLVFSCLSLRCTYCLLVVYSLTDLFISVNNLIVNVLTKLFLHSTASLLFTFYGC